MYCTPGVSPVTSMDVSVGRPSESRLSSIVGGTLAVTPTGGFTSSCILDGTQVFGGWMPVIMHVEVPPLTRLFVVHASLGVVNPGSLTPLPVGGVVCSAVCTNLARSG